MPLLASLCPRMFVPMAMFSVGLHPFTQLQGRPLAPATAILSEAKLAFAHFERWRAISYGLLLSVAISKAPSSTSMCGSFSAIASNLISEKYVTKTTSSLPGALEIGK